MQAICIGVGAILHCCCHPSFVNKVFFHDGHAVGCLVILTLGTKATIEFFVHMREGNNDKHHTQRGEPTKNWLG